MDATWFSRLSRSEQGFLVLLRAGLWAKQPETETVFPLSEKEWEGIYMLSQIHTVQGLVFQGVCHLPEEYMPPVTIIEDLTVEVDVIERKNQKMDGMIRDLFNLFERNDLHPVLLKGQGVARYYEVPEQRSCGDIDLYFKTEKSFLRACSLIEAHKIPVIAEPDGARMFVWHGIVVEIHNRMIDVYNPMCQKRLADFQVKHDCDDVYPAPIVNMILLNTHVLKHLIGPGIGLRQIADMARACYCLEGHYAKDEYQHLCRQLHIQRWSRQLSSLLRNVLQLPSTYLPCEESDELDEKLLGRILKGGNFGFYHDLNSSTHTKKQRGKLSTIKHSISHLPSSLYYAPYEALFYFFTLVKGQFSFKYR